MTDENLATFTCRLPGCGGPRSGVCINNLPFEECPDVAPPGEESDETVPDASIEAMPVPVVPCRGGRSLDAISCDALLRERGGMVVGLVAGPEVGKTTLIATMYELLHRGRMSSFGFAGSETLRGYEERCHLARLSSNGNKPDTQHTPTKAQLSFTHLRIATRNGVKDVIFSDRSGEHFDRVLSRPGEIAGFAELARADVILFLIDLTELVGNQHVPTSCIRRLFIAMDQNALLTGKEVFLIGTKRDIAIPTPRSRRAMTMLEEAAADLTRRSTSGVVVMPYAVASRPRKDSSVIGEGIEQLLAMLLKDKSPLTPPSFHVWPETVTELDLLMRMYRAKSR